MSGRYGRYCAALGGLVLATAALAQQQPHSPKHHGQPTSSAQAGGAQGPSAYETQSLAISRDANTIARLQAGYSLGQVWLGGAAALFTAIAAGAAIAAAIYAKKAADHTEAAATTAAEALTDSRASATEQADRFDKQLEVANQSVDAAEAAAAASGQAARWMRSSANAAHRQFDLAERALTIVERPYLVFAVSPVRMPMKGVAWPIATTTAVSFGFRNVGRTPAYIHEISADFGVYADVPEAPNYKAKPMLGQTVVGARKKTITFNRASDSAIRPAEIGRMTVSALNIIFYGYVKYRDIFGNEHVTGFGANWSILENAFSTATLPAYNYEKTEPKKA